jgi:hypothetical protein
MKSSCHVLSGELALWKTSTLHLWCPMVAGSYLLNVILIKVNLILQRRVWNILWEKTLLCIMIQSNTGTCLILLAHSTQNQLHALLNSALFWIRINLFSKRMASHTSLSSEFWSRWKVLIPHFHCSKRDISRALPLLYTCEKINASTWP